MNFRKLEVYQIAIKIFTLSLRIEQNLPAGHGAVRDQLRRAALSIPLNIAEATGKTKIADQRRFFAIARGSAMECGAIIDVCRVLGGVEKGLLDDIDRRLLSVVRMLSKMARN